MQSWILLTALQIYSVSYFEHHFIWFSCRVESPNWTKTFFFFSSFRNQFTSAAQLLTSPKQAQMDTNVSKKKKDFQVNKYISQRHVNKVTRTRNDKQQGGVWSQTVRTTKDWYEIALSWKLFARLWWWWCCYCIQINASLGGVKSRKLTLVFILTCRNRSVTFDDDDDDVKPRRVWRKNLLMSNPPTCAPL